MKKRVLYSAMSTVMALGMLTACGADNNRMNNDGDVDYRPVRYNPDNNMDGNRENNNGVFDNDAGQNNRNTSNFGNNRGDRRTNVLNRDRNRNVEPAEYGDNEIDTNSTRGMTERSDGRGMMDRGNRALNRNNNTMNENDGMRATNRDDNGVVNRFNRNETDNDMTERGMTDNDRNGLGGMNANLSGDR